MLIVEADRTMARRMADVLGGGNGERRRRAADHAGPREPCRVIGSLQALFEQDLARAELVICDMDLPDGSGLNALDYLRGRFPHLPVILVGPGDEASVAVEAIRAGAVDFLTTGHDLQALPLAVEKCLALQRVKLENQRLQHDLGDSLTELAVKNQQLQALVRQLESAARTDDLTGLRNRRSLNELLERAWEHAGGKRRILAFMMIDLDDFKRVNDRMGHLRGDEVLREAGRIIQSSCRQEDVPARYGGDEFCVLMPDSDAREVVAVAERIIREFELANHRKPADEPRISMSIGVAQTTLSGPRDPWQLVSHADEALYAAKAAGKARVIVRGRNGPEEPSAISHQPSGKKAADILP